MMKYLFFFVLLVVAQDVQACTCKSLPKLTREAAGELSGAYLGKIVLIEKTDNSNFLKISLLVTERYRGETIDTLVFNATDDPGICGISAGIGEEWLITFENRNEELPFITMCSRAYDFSGLTERRKHFRFRYRYHENRYARKELSLARHDLRVLKRLKLN